jgi:uncharacterized protein (DUF302 family)
MQSCYSQETEGTLEDVCERIESAAVAHQFKVFSRQSVDELIGAQGTDGGLDGRVIEIGHHDLFRIALQYDPSLVPLMTFRISVWRQPEKVRVSTVLRNSLVTTVHNPEIQSVADSAQTALKRVIDSACGTQTRLDRVLQWNMC